MLKTNSKYFILTTRSVDVSSDYRQYNWHVFYSKETASWELSNDSPFAALNVYLSPTFLGNKETKVVPLGAELIGDFQKNQRRPLKGELAEILTKEYNNSLQGKFAVYVAWTTEAGKNIDTQIMTTITVHE